MWFAKSRRAQSVDDYETWIQGGVVPTLNAFDNGDTRATVLIIDGTRVDDVRVIETGIVPTVISRWGTGGGNVPAIAFSIREDAKANNFSATETETALTLQGHQPSPQSHHAQIFIVEEESKVFEPKSAFEENWAESQVKNALRAGASKSSHAITNQATVRRLTPTECERLQGFPDGWTAERFDEKKQAVIAQADSNRYKQMGNAVAVPVVDWIIKRLVAAQ